MNFRVFFFFFFFCFRALLLLSLSFKNESTEKEVSKQRAII